jgi:hypothetical protein
MLFHTSALPDALKMLLQMQRGSPISNAHFLAYVTVCQGYRQQTAAQLISLCRVYGGR